MLRTLTTLLAVALTGIICTPAAQARPGFCADHDAGGRYITACATGNGNSTGSDWAQRFRIAMDAVGIDRD